MRAVYGVVCMFGWLLLQLKIMETLNEMVLCNDNVAFVVLHHKLRTSCHKVCTSPNANAALRFVEAHEIKER